MSRGAGALTLLVAAIVFVVGGITGLRLLTASTGSAEAVPTCRDTVVRTGDELASNQVRVNVFNASNRSGLANRALIDLQANGFLSGEIGNSTSTTTPRTVTILTKDRRDPRVRLVAAQFRNKVSYAEPDVTVGEGIVVLVGNKYTGIKKSAISTIKTDRDIPVCEPVTLP